MVPISYLPALWVIMIKKKISKKKKKKSRDLDQWTDWASRRKNLSFYLYSNDVTGGVSQNQFWNCTFPVTYPANWITLPKRIRCPKLMIMIFTVIISN